MRARHLFLAALVLACDRSAERTGAPSAETTMMRALPPDQPTPTRPARAVPQLEFEDYVVADTSRRRRRPAAVDLRSAEYGRMYRTKLREGAAAGPNFAGHYTVVFWGCGTGCQVVSVVDARTGRLSRQTLLTSNGVRYQRNSRLLFVDPPTPEQPPECASCGTPAYYEWRGGRLRPVGPGPHPHLGGPRPWRTECTPSDTTPAAATGLFTCPEHGSR